MCDGSSVHRKGGAVAGLGPVLKPRPPPPHKQRPQGPHVCEQAGRACALQSPPNTRATAAHPVLLSIREQVCSKAHVVQTQPPTQVPTQGHRLDSRSDAPLGGRKQPFWPTSHLTCVCRCKDQVQVLTPSADLAQKSTLLNPPPCPKAGRLQGWSRDCSRQVRLPSTHVILSASLSRHFSDT